MSTIAASHNGLTVTPRFFTAVASYLGTERPADAEMDRLFVGLKGRRRGQPLSAAGLDQILDSARATAGLAQGTCHHVRHTCLTRLRKAGMAWKPSPPSAATAAST